MPSGDSSKHAEKQKRQAEHIEEGYDKESVTEEKASQLAWLR